MNGKRAKEIRRKAKGRAELHGRELQDTEYDINGRVVIRDELRQIKKEYKELKRQPKESLDIQMTDWIVEALNRRK